MTYHEVTLPTTMVAEKNDGVVNYYKGASAVVAGLAAKQGKIASVEMQQFDATSAYHATDEESNQEALEQEFSVANDPIRFVPIATAIWAGVEPGDQYVHAPVQLQFLATGAVNIRVAPKWVEQFKGKKLRVACET